MLSAIKTFVGLVVQPLDSKIVMCGSVGDDLVLLRLMPNGVDLDPTFGERGMVRNSGPQGVAGGHTRLALLPDGRIVMAGFSIVARFLADGTPDAGFGDHGRRMIDAPGLTHVYNLALDRDGSIVVTGFDNWLSRYFTLARYQTNGEPDLHFGGAGFVRIDHGVPGMIYALGTQSDGKVLPVGRLDEPSPMFVVYRVRPDGQLDAAPGAAITTPVPKNGPVENHTTTAPSP